MGTPAEQGPPAPASDKPTLQLPVVEQTSSGSSARLRSLDGLRGLAALIVVFHHLSMTIPQLSNVFYVPGEAPAQPGTALWWFSAGPGQLLVAGPEAVQIFFVLSGVVLVLPVLRNPRFDWLSYYPRRLVRLYFPVLGSVLFAAVLIAVSAQTPWDAASGWISYSSSPAVDWRALISAADVLFGDPKPVNSPLWSLRWEVLFSLLLPAYVVLAVAARRWSWWLVVGSVAVSFVGVHAGNGALTYLPAFLIGAVIAANLSSIARWAARPAVIRFAGIGGLVLLIVALVAMNLHWMLWGQGVSAIKVRSAATTAVVVGAAVLVVLSAFWRPLVRLLTTRVFHWLGRVSFSLYLVHVPIIVAVSSVVRPGRPVLTIVLSLVLSAIAAELFARLVEIPSHRASRWVGQKAAQTVPQTAPH